MQSSLRGKSIRSIDSLSLDEIQTVLRTAELLKMRHKSGKEEKVLEGKVIACIFQKPSTRTKVSFLAGISELGGTALYLDARDMQLGRGETIEDTARVLSRFVDAIVARVRRDEDIDMLIKYGSVPVINGLSADYHPCQALTDLFTMYEHLPQIQGLKISNFKGLKITYTGDGTDNMAHVVMRMAVKLGMHVSVACPNDYRPSQAIIDEVNHTASITGSKIEITDNILAAAKGADVLYTDTFVSMGEEEKGEESLRKKVDALKPYILDERVVAAAPKGVLVMHPLPAHRGNEISAGLMDAPDAVMWDEAENRKHVQKALLSLILA
jgi:ornithine carbamoyltransferase